MIGVLLFLAGLLASPFRSKSRLEAENAVLRHQLMVLRRKMQDRVNLTNNDRWFFIQMYRWFPSVLKVVAIIRPETLVRWHRKGFRIYWRWKSRSRGGRPQTTLCIVRLSLGPNLVFGTHRSFDARIGCFCTKKARHFCRAFPIDGC